MSVTCPLNVVEETLVHLREAGLRNCECVVLWLGQRRDTEVIVKQAYLPIQIVREDMFHIPSEGMAALHSHLRANRWMVAAQVHSHPDEAFHSRADDRWAIIRHEGALSLVVPYFASTTTASALFESAKIFRFSDDKRWIEVPVVQMDLPCLTIS